MRFVSFTNELLNEDKLIVDGMACGTGLQLSHWPGNATPAELKADLSVEIALRLAVNPFRDRHIDGRETVTNDHYDSDGLLAVYALLRPDEAVKNRAALIDAAEAGDFYEFTSPRAVQFDLIVRAFENIERSPLSSQLQGLSDQSRMQICTEALLAELPDLLYSPERYRDLWEEPYARHIERLEFINSGNAIVTEWPEERLTVIRTPQFLDHMSRNYIAHGHRILEIVETPEGIFYILHYRECLWYDLISRPASPKYRLTAVAAQLDEMESNGEGFWAITEWTPALRRVQGEMADSRIAHRKAPLRLSSISADKVVGLLREWFSKADSKL